MRNMRHWLFVASNESLAQTNACTQFVILIRVIMSVFISGSILYTSLIMKANSQRLACCLPARWVID